MEVWQIHFDEEETKTDYAVDMILPRQLISPLEDYLAKTRPILVTGAGPNTLFVNRHGGAFRGRSFSSLVKNLTRRYAGKAVNPHLFRDIFAHKWLRDHPRDYLTLSKILWHRNIQTTLKKYGWNFNESDGACAVDEWLDERS